MKRVRLKPYALFLFLDFVMYKVQAASFDNHIIWADALSTAESYILSIVKGKKDKTSLESETLARYTLI
jgi:hypothetical protein